MGKERARSGDKRWAHVWPRFGHSRCEGWRGTAHDGPGSPLHTIDRTRGPSPPRTWAWDCRTRSGAEAGVECGAMTRRRGPGASLVRRCFHLALAVEGALARLPTHDCLPWDGGRPDLEVAVAAETTHQLGGCSRPARGGSPREATRHRFAVQGSSVVGDAGDHSSVVRPC